MRHLCNMLALVAVLAGICLAIPGVLASPNSRGAPDGAFSTAGATIDGAILTAMGDRDQISIREEAAFTTTENGIIATGPGPQFRTNVTTAKSATCAGMNAPASTARSEAVVSGETLSVQSFRSCAEGIGTDKTEVMRHLPLT